MSQRGFVCALWALLLVCSIIVSGCDGQAPLPESESGRFSGRTLQRSVYPKRYFAAEYSAAEHFPLAFVPVIGPAIGFFLPTGPEIVQEHARQRGGCLVSLAR